MPIFSSCTNDASLTITVFNDGKKNTIIKYNDYGGKTILKGSQGVVMNLDLFCISWKLLLDQAIQITPKFDTILMGVLLQNPLY